MRNLEHTKFDTCKHSVQACSSPHHTGYNSVQTRIGAPNVLWHYLFLTGENQEKGTSRIESFSYDQSMKIP